MAFTRSFQQTPEKIYDLSHFKREHQPFFNKNTFGQLKDAAGAVLAREKRTSLAEMFSVEFKFTTDTLNDWFSNIIKPKFLELSDIKKDIFRKRNSIVSSETNCWICGLLLDVEARGKHKRWYDFIINCKHLFLRNIYSENDLKNMEIQTEHKDYDIFNRFIRLFSELKVLLMVEKCMKNLEMLFLKILTAFIQRFLN